MLVLITSGYCCLIKHDLKRHAVKVIEVKVIEFFVAAIIAKSLLIKRTAQLIFDSSANPKRSSCTKFALGVHVLIKCNYIYILRGKIEGENRESPE